MTTTLNDASADPALHRAGEYGVYLHSIKDELELTGKRKVYAIFHVAHDVIAGYAQQLPGAIEAAEKLDTGLRNQRASQRKIAN